MREIEKAMRQRDKGASCHAMVSRQFSETALPNPSGRPDSGRSTPTGRTTPRGTTRSGITTPTGSATPLSTAASGLTTPTCRVTPSGITPATGRITPPGMESGLTTPTGSVTPYGTTIAGSSSPVVPVGEPLKQAGCILARAAAALPESARHATAAVPESAHHATAAVLESTHHATAGDSTAAGMAANQASVTGSEEGGAESGGRVARLLSSRSSVKDAVALYEGSRHVSHGQPFSGGRQPCGEDRQPYGGRIQSFKSDGQPFDGDRQPINADGQPFSRRGQLLCGDRQMLPVSSGQPPINSDRQMPPFSNGQGPISNDLQAPSSKEQPTSGLSTHAQTTAEPSGQSSGSTATGKVPYQTRSLSEGVYGKLYNSRNSRSGSAVSAEWHDDNTIRHGSGGTDASGSGRHVIEGTGVAAGGGIGRFGGGIGRRGRGGEIQVDYQSEHETQSTDSSRIKQ